MKIPWNAIHEAVEFVTPNGKVQGRNGNVTYKVYTVSGGIIRVDIKQESDSDPDSKSKGKSH